MACASGLSLFFLCASLSVCFVVVAVCCLCGMVRSKVGCVSSVPSGPRVLCMSTIVIDIVSLDGSPLKLKHCTTQKWQDDVDWDGCSEDLAVVYPFWVLVVV